MNNEKDNIMKCKNDVTQLNVYHSNSWKQSGFSFTKVTVKYYLSENVCNLFVN